ncbi:MAG: hypothetical protein IKR04_07040 [Clostridia bacterium]|nr:hypothetical protein [Clostridia bacterium]
MRQVKKARIVFFLIGLILGCVLLGGLGFTLISQRDKQIAELNAQKADGKMYAFARDIKANSEILPGDIIALDTKKMNFANGGYYGEGSDLMGYSWSHYVLVRDKDGTEHQEMIGAEDPSMGTALVGKVVKADVYMNQPVNDSVLYPDEDIPSASERYAEYNFLQLPTDLVENEYVDVRIQFPTGEDYIVLVGKKVVSYDTQNSIMLKLNEDEILAMGSAIIETYMDEGVRLYARKYTDPATQLYNEKLVNLVEDYKNGYATAKANILAGLPTQFDESGDPIPVPEGSTEPTIADIAFNTTYLKNLNSILIEEIKEAIDKDNKEKLAYFSSYRYLESKKLARTYPLKKEVLNLIRTKPNILQEIVTEFTNIAANNTRQDELERLRADLETAPYASSLPYGSNTDNVKTKESITQEILTLEENRKASIAENLENEQKTSRQERVAYLNSLLGSSTSEENY